MERSPSIVELASGEDYVKTLEIETEYIVDEYASSRSASHSPTSSPSPTVKFEEIVCEPANFNNNKSIHCIPSIPKPENSSLGKLQLSDCLFFLFFLPFVNIYIFCCNE